MSMLISMLINYNYIVIWILTCHNTTRFAAIDI